MKTQKKETTESIQKSICRSCLMQFHLCELCGFKKGNHGEHKEIIDIGLIYCNSTSVYVVVSKEETTESTMKLLL